MLRQQGDNMIIKYQSCHAIVKQDGSHYMINLAPVLFENMTVTFMDITKCSYGVPSFSNKKNSTDPISNFQLGLGMYYTYVRMYDR